MAITAGSVAGVLGGAGLRRGFEAALDAAVETAVRSSKLPVPGVVVLARRGTDRYCKAFGHADLATRKPMKTDAMMRFYSMTKVQTSCLALMLAEKGWLSFTDPVSKYIASFNRDWQIATGSEDEGDPSIDHYDAMTGQTRSLRYRLRPARETMLVKHLMSEHSGLAYEFWSDVGFSQEYAVAWELRKRVSPGFFSSTSILGTDLALREWCDAVAEAGVLVCEPGTYSYGLGATVLGRVIEVAYHQGSGKERTFEEIMKEMLWGPLSMDEATFFLADGDPRAARVPVLYGAVLSTDGNSAEPKRIEECYPGSCSNQHDHTAGPRRHFSGDTGSMMPITDYEKFAEFLLRRGLSPTGERLLSVTGVETLCRRAFKGLQHDVPIARALKGACASYPQSFNFGWVTTHAHSGQELDGYEPMDHPRCNYWSGYSNVHIRFFLDDDAYIILAPQVMGNTSGAKFMDEVLRVPVVKAFLDMWEEADGPSKRHRIG